MFVTLEQAKKHLLIDMDFKDDDCYITSLIQVAEDAVAKHLDIPLYDLLEDGLLPKSIHQAILLLMANFYQNREPIAMASVTPIPYTFEYLISLYKSYNKPF